MTRQLEAKREQKQDRADRALVRAIEYELVDSVERAGGVLDGFSVRCGQGDCLLTLRCTLAGNAVVCYLGAETLSDCFRKAVREAQRDKLKWRPSKYG